MAKNSRYVGSRLATTVNARYYPDEKVIDAYYLDGRFTANTESRAVRDKSDYEDRGFFNALFAYPFDEGSDVQQTSFAKAVRKLNQEIKDGDDTIDNKINDLADMAIEVGGRATLAQEGVRQTYFSGLIVQDGEIAAVTTGDGCAFLYKANVLYPLTAGDFELDAVDLNGNPVQYLNNYSAGVAGTIRYSNLAEIEEDDILMLCNREVLDILGQREIMRLLAEAAGPEEAAQSIITAAAAKQSGVSLQLMISLVEYVKTVEAGAPQKRPQMPQAQPERLARAEQFVQGDPHDINFPSRDPRQDTQIYGYEAPGAPQRPQARMQSPERAPHAKQPYHGDPHDPRHRAYAVAGAATVGAAATAAAAHAMNSQEGEEKIMRQPQRRDYQGGGEVRPNHDFSAPVPNIPPRPQVPNYNSETHAPHPYEEQVNPTDAPGYADDFSAYNEPAFPNQAPQTADPNYQAAPYDDEPFYNNEAGAGYDNYGNDPYLDDPYAQNADQDYGDDGYGAGYDNQYDGVGNQYDQYGQGGGQAYDDYGQGYDDGYDQYDQDGYDQGYDPGYDQGYDPNYEQGQGYSDQYYDDGAGGAYDDGYGDQGYYDEYQDQYYDEYQQNYQDGYEDYYEDQKDDHIKRIVLYVVLAAIIIVCIFILVRLLGNNKKKTEESIKASESEKASISQSIQQSEEASRKEAEASQLAEEESKRKAEENSKNTEKKADENKESEGENNEGEEGKDNGAANNGEAKTYTVKFGDTFYAILNSYYNSSDPAIVEKVLEANPNITNPDALYEGLEIVLPPME